MQQLNAVASCLCLLHQPFCVWLAEHGVWLHTSLSLGLHTGLFLVWLNMGSPHDRSYAECLLRRDAPFPSFGLVARRLR